MLLATRYLYSQSLEVVQSFKCSWCYPTDLVVAQVSETRNGNGSELFLEEQSDQSRHCLPF